MRRFGFGIALSAAAAAFAVAAAPALADNHEWVMEGDEYPTGQVKGIAYGDGLFVAAEYQCTTECFKYSSDGEEWEVGTHPPVNASYSHFKDVEYGDGNFVAVGGYKIFYSEDGKTWQQAQAPGDRPSWDQVTYNEEKDTWVALHGSQGKLTYSTDGGKTWTAPQSFGVSNSFWSIANNGEAYVMAASYDPSPRKSQFVYLTHADMLAGNPGTITASTDFGAGNPNYLDDSRWGYVNWNAATQKWVVVSGEYNDHAGIAASANGVDWNVYVNPFITGSWYRGVSVGDQVLHVGKGTRLALIVDPNDAGNPSGEDLPNNAKGMVWEDVAYGNGMYVAVAGGPNNAVGRTMRKGEVAQLPEVPEDVLPENPVIIDNTDKPIGLPNNRPVYFPIAPFAPATPTWDPNARGACERSETNKKLAKCVSGMTKLPDFTGIYALKANLSGTTHKMKGACRWDGDDSECRVYLNRKGNWRLTWTAGDKTTARTVRVG